MDKTEAQIVSYGILYLNLLGGVETAIDFLYGG